jgi:dTDP-4-dehydrorhamnose reductase
MSKLLILGGSGMLGTSLASQCALGAIAYDAPRSNTLDIRKRDEVQNYIQRHKPDAIVNCAAWTDVENSESEYPNAIQLNVDAVQNIAIAAREAGLPVVHISTDYVFDGTKREAYSEGDSTNPINSYGVSKMLGEKVFLSVTFENSYIIRTSWLYGASGNNFVKTILGKALVQKRIQVVNDQYGSPTNSEDLARGILAILQKKPAMGVYHYTNAGVVSWFEFAKRIYQLAGTDVNLIEPIQSTAYPTKVKRPSRSVLSTKKWEKAEISKLICWEESLTRIFPRILASMEGPSKR